MELPILRHIKVPTGDILMVEGEHGPLELVSLGDYGKDVNLKADFLGLSRDPGTVRHTDLLPITEKWVVTISTQYGCSMGCRMCDVPKVGSGRNASFGDMMGQVETALTLHPEVTRCKRLNVHFARMGEPTFNRDVLAVAHYLCARYENAFSVHPVVSTMMPRHNRDLDYFLRAWCDIKNVMGGEAGLQISVNSTDHWEREAIFSCNAHILSDVSSMCAGLPDPVGRKYTLNFAVAGWEIDAPRLARMFSPDRFLVKLTPMHRTCTARDHGYRTPAGETMAPYREHEEALKAAGFDVIVFIASDWEDRSLITCGNAILSGSIPDADVPHEVVR